MKFVNEALVLGTIALTFSTGTASAQGHRHRSTTHHRSVQRVVVYRSLPYGYPGQYGYPTYEYAAPYYRNSQQPAPVPFVPAASDYSPGAVVLRRTIKAQVEPGLTNELAPDSAQTASGGPVGGIPGYSPGGR